MCARHIMASCIQIHSSCLVPRCKVSLSSYDVASKCLDGSLSLEAECHSTSLAAWLWNCQKFEFLHIPWHILQHNPEPRCRSDTLTPNRQDDAQVGRSSSAVEKTVTAVARLKEGWIPKPKANASVQGRARTRMAVPRMPRMPRRRSELLASQY